jgi:hypothetical protein
VRVLFAKSIAHFGSKSISINHLIILKTIDMELRKEIHDVVNALPEDVLPKVLEYVHRVEREKKGVLNLKRHYKRIVEEDANLLKRLAQ